MNESIKHHQGVNKNSVAWDVTFEIIKGRHPVCWLGVRYEECSLYRCKTRSSSLSKSSFLLRLAMLILYEHKYVLTTSRLKSASPNIQTGGSSSVPLQLPLHSSTFPLFSD